MMIGANNQKCISVDRTQLLEKLLSNREKHIQAYTEAMEGYRRSMVRVLEKLLGDAKDGKDVGHFIELTRPESHEEEYDLAIEMLRWSVEETVVIDLGDFRKFVQDKWAWSEAFALTNATYSVK